MAKTVDHKQLKNIRLNVTNIRSSLVSANKTLASLRSEKLLLIKKQIEDKKLKDKEAKVEKKVPATALGRFMNEPIKSTKSFFQKLLELGATILLGQLITVWPRLMARFNQWKENMSGIIEGVVKTFTIIGSGITGFVKWIGGINTQDIDQRTSQLDKETDAVMKNVDVVSQEADDASSMLGKKDDSGAKPDNDNETRETKEEKNLDKNNEKSKKLKSTGPSSTPNLNNNQNQNEYISGSGETVYPARESKLKTPNAGVIKGLTRNQIDSILATPAGTFSPIADVRVTDKLKNEVRQHLSSAVIKPVSNKKDKVIEELNSKKTGNGKTKTTLVTVTQTKEKLVVVPTTV